MKNLFVIIAVMTLIACKNDKEAVSNQSTIDSAKSVVDSARVPVLKNSGGSVAFQVTPLNVSGEKGRTVFRKNGNVLFYFDQTSNEGNIRIDGKDYLLNSFNFSENNYSVKGNGVVIEALNGDFEDGTAGCIQGKFPEIKVVLQGKEVSIANIQVQDCPDY